MDISIIIPCYCSGKNIVNVVEEIKTILMEEKKSYEIILVNDGSPDNTYEIISDIANQNNNTYAVDLAKNCGQHAAIMAGFKYAKGELIMTCEDDGQTQLSILPHLIDKINEGYDVAAPKYQDRGKRSLFRKLGTKCAILMGNWMIPRPKGMLVPIYFVAKKFVIKEILKYNQPFPYIEGLILRSTFNIALVDAKQNERLSGRSGYTLKKMIKLWLNGFTSFSIKPLRPSVFLGILSSVVGILVGIYIVIQRLFNENIVSGWSSIIAVMLFMFGIVLLVLGMIGEYVGRIYLCINMSPQYVVRQVVCKNGVKEEGKENGEENK